jgi:hypothetical protein
LKVGCLGQSSCRGSITLRTLSAVSAAKRKAILTLASGSFSLSGGQVKAVALHLSAKARALLIRSHVLRAKVTIVGHDSAGVAHTMQSVVTLRLVKPKHHGTRAAPERAARVSALRWRLVEGRHGPGPGQDHVNDR